MTGLERVLVERDGLSLEEAKKWINDVRIRIIEGEEDPEEVLLEEFGLEPDYIFDILL